MRYVPPLLGACFLLLTTAPAAAQQVPAFSPLPTVELPPELDRVLRDYERAWQASDELALGDLFVSDGYVPSQKGWVRGRAAIIEDYQNGSGDLRLRAVGYGTHSDMGYIIGAYNYGQKQPGASDRGNFVLVLQRDQTGKWLIVADVDKTNQP